MSRSLHQNRIASAVTPPPHTYTHVGVCVLSTEIQQSIGKARLSLLACQSWLPMGGSTTEAFRSCNGAQNVPFTTLCICLIHKTVVSHSGGSAGSWMTQAGGNGMVREAIPFFVFSRCVRALVSSFDVRPPLGCMASEDVGQ